MKRVRLSLFAALLIVALGAVVSAQNAPEAVPFKLDTDKPINMAGDRVSFDNKLHVVRWIGNVVATQDNVKISSDMVLIYLDETKKSDTAAATGPADLSGGMGSIKTIVATGRVVIIQEDRKATCDQAVFDQQKGLITLEGSPQLFSGNDQLQGSRIVVNIKEQRVEVTGSPTRRVQASVLPKGGDKVVMTPEAEKRVKDLQENPPKPDAASKEKTEKDKDESIPPDEPTP